MRRCLAIEGLAMSMSIQVEPVEVARYWKGLSNRRAKGEPWRAYSVAGVTNYCFDVEECV